MLTTESKNLKATVNGEVVTEIPEDLFIPPDALRVILEKFEGPLDLLLYLIKKQNVDIIDIPIFPITQQYVEYINLMQQLEFELASDYLVMASTLAEIKSRMLVPNEIDEDEEEDPRAELIRRLLEYERYRTVSEEINQLDRVDRDIFLSAVDTDQFNQPIVLPDIQVMDLVVSFQEVLKKAEMFSTLHFMKEPLSVKERMTMILETIQDKDFVRFEELFNLEEERIGLVVTFLAILELMKELLIEIVQAKEFGIIHVKTLVEK